jgi:hypothetical protein
MTFFYFPLIPRLAANFRSATWARLVRYPAERQATPGSISDVMDGEIWRDQFIGGGYAEPGSVNLAFSISCDAFVVDRTKKVKVKPINLTNLCLPPWQRSRGGSIMLSTLLPRAATHDKFDIYMTPLMEEFAVLQKEGVLVSDAGTTPSTSRQVCMQL